MINFMDDLLFGLNDYSCEGSYLLPLFQTMKFFIVVIQIAVPFALIIWGSLDWFKALIAHDEKEMRMKRKPFIQRVIAAMIVLMLPWLIQLTSKYIAGKSTNNKIWKCYTDAKAKIDFSFWQKATTKSSNGKILGDFDGGGGKTPRSVVSSCDSISSQATCESSETKLNMCKWEPNTGQKVHCIPGSPKITKNNCSDFNNSSDCNRGQTKTWLCTWDISASKCTNGWKR